MKKVALIGSYPPRECGIATFTYDLNQGIKENRIQTSVIAMNDGLQKYDYSDDVGFQVEQNEISSYRKAANFINTNNFDAVILQHEFGIFSGTYGRNIVALLKRLRIPVITTLHTITDDPSEEQRKVLEEVSKYSEKVVSISMKGLQLLHGTFDLPLSKCKHIHHGVPKKDLRDRNKVQIKLGLDNKRNLLTFGLLSRNKSIEVTIKALPRVIEKHPDVAYIVLGATHPHVIKEEGEAYRYSLIRLVKKLGLEQNVAFIDRFVSKDVLFDFLKACDIYVIPYSEEKQISSGTLISAMSMGKPIISTPFWYAKEMLADDRGLFFDFNDSEQLSKQIIYLLDNDEKRERLSKKALDYTKKCYWSDIGKQYVDLLKELSAKKTKVSLREHIASEIEPSLALPPINLKHLQTLTDDNGMLQHARYNIPNRSHGYCLDDNARALILSVMLQNEVKDVDEVSRLTNIYLSFIDYSFNQDNKKFRNFMSYQRQWLESEGSEDSSGRAMWALGYTILNTQNQNYYLLSKSLFDGGLEKMTAISSPRALAYLILGLVSYSKKDRKNTVLELLKNKTRQLYSVFDKTIHTEWPWYEEKVTYANNRIAQALIVSGDFLNDSDLSERGVNILDWLIGKQYVEDVFSPIGNKGWLTRETQAEFDQQPLEANGMIAACLVAEKLTKEEKYGDYALKAFAWFTGDNICSQTLYDFSTGGCRDGLHPDGANLNEGAESTLSWIISLMEISSYLQSNSK